jgi:outer membrane protein assembly factor BamB
MRALIATVAASILLLAVAAPTGAAGPAEGGVGVAGAASPVAQAAADNSNWPQWRGPGSNGISSETGLPMYWTDTENILWKTEIEGRSHSSPIVWGDQVFLTTAVRGEVVPGHEVAVHSLFGEAYLHPDAVDGNRSHKLEVMSLNAETGTILWKKVVFEGPMFGDRHRRGSFAAPTPATDGELVYTWFGSEGMYAFDFDGNQVWSADLGQIKTIGLGVGTSPVLYEDLVILQCDENDGQKSFIAALDKKTGEEVWRKSRPVQISWTTPNLVAAPDGSIELVTVSHEFTIAYKPATGEEIWRTEGVRSNPIATPVVDGNRVFVSAGFPRKITMAIDTGGTGDITDTEYRAWNYEKGTAYVVSNLFYQGYLYLLNDQGILTCLDAETGEVVYEGGRVPIPATFKASPVAFDGKILLASEDGDVFIIKAGPKHELLISNSLNEPIWASPAIANGTIFIRGDRHLFAIREMSGTGS